MATTDTSICSGALTLLGIETIDSLTEETENAETCAQIYAVTRDALISEYPWRFAIEKAQLSRLVDAPENEWKFAFQLPSTIVGGPHAVFDSGVQGAPIVKNWELFGDKLFSNYEALWVDFRVSANESKFPHYFTQLMVYEMAWKLADAVTEDMEKTKLWFKVARGDSEEGGKGGYYRTATQADAFGNTGSVIRDHTLIQARMGGG